MMRSISLILYRFVVDEFLEQLDPVAIKRLCELYKMDFLVFGFTHKRCKFGGNGH